MDLYEYQREAIKTAKPWDNKDWALAYHALGLVGEAGEAVDMIKKHFRGDRPLDAERTEMLKKELADVMWYIANICDTLGIEMADLPQTNIDKLRARHGETFSGYGDRSGAGK
jgi:NTP pyrophosphatase (non-canonical NTP hydrolase)